jgi:adenosine deaminase
VAALVDVARSRQCVVGIDLAGGPVAGHTWRMDDYAPAFARAADIGLGRTVHAGEGRPPAEIRTAIERLGAHRIGHGTTLLDDPSVADLVIERGIVIEACPTSNVHTGVIAAAADHPIATWIDRGVKVCVCSDNTLLSATTSRIEHERARTATGMDDARLAQAIEVGHAAAFRRG